MWICLEHSEGEVSGIWHPVEYLAQSHGHTRAQYILTENKACNIFFFQEVNLEPKFLFHPKLPF